MPLFEKLSNIQTFDPRWAEHNFHHFLPLSFTMRILTIHHSIAFAIAVIGRVKNIGFCVMLPSQFRSYLPASHHEMMSTAYGLKRKGSSSSSSYGILYCVIYWTRFLLCTSVRMCGLSFIFLFFSFAGVTTGLMGPVVRDTTQQISIAFLINSVRPLWPCVGHVIRNQIHSYALEYIVIEKEIAQSWRHFSFLLSLRNFSFS